MRKMDPKGNCIHILSIDKKVNDFLVNSIKKVIGDQIEVKGFTMGNCLNQSDANPLVVASGKFLFHAVKKMYPHNRIICAKRTINGSNLDKLFALSKGKKVLVVNHPREVVEETISALKVIGINHLKYIPYWKGNKVFDPDIDTAISPGMIHLCPDWVEKKIDIGMRTIAFSTFMEILNHFHMDAEYIDQFANEYIKIIIQAEQYLNEAFRKTEVLGRNLQSIINGIDEAIVSVDEDQRICQFNPAAEQLFGFLREELLGKRIEDVFNHMEEMISFIKEKREKSNQLLSIPDKKILASSIPLSKESKENYIFTFKEAEEIQKIEENLRRVLYHKGYVAKYTFKDIVAFSKPMEKTISAAKKIAKSDFTVLLVGESGTGKELLAHAIHNESPRKGGPFVAVNFAALPENLIESELFGYEEGAFTGAKKGGKKGLFEQAHGGTILLDEIGDASLYIQSRLLRVLQEREVMRVGATKILPIDVRVIAATNKNLSQMVEKGLFREDLYYRLKVMPLTIPPLRERKEDISYLIKAFMQKYGVSKRLSKNLEEFLFNYRWPGNVRELENTIEYITYISQREILEMEDLPEDIRNDDVNGEKIDDVDIEIMEKLLCLFDLDEIRFILETLMECKEKKIRIGRRNLADKAGSAGLSLSEERIRTIFKHMEEYGILLKGRTKQGTMITEKGKKVLGAIRGF